MSTRLTELTPVWCDPYIPEVLEEGNLYISEAYSTSQHLCPCGCKSRVVLPWKLVANQFWTLTKQDNLVTLRPSVGNYAIPCKTHYYITHNKIEWL